MLFLKYRTKFALIHSDKKNQDLRRLSIHTKFERMNIKECTLYLESILFRVKLKCRETLIKYILTPVTINPIPTVAVLVGDIPADKC